MTSFFLTVDLHPMCKNGMPNEEGAPAPRRRRMVPVVIGRIPDAEMRSVFERVRREVKGVSPSAVTCLWNFVSYHHEVCRSPQPPWDLRVLNGTREGAETARAAWDRLVAALGLRGQYRRRVSAALSRALTLVVPALATVIQPDRRHRPVASSLVVALRSAVAHEFSIHECVPLRVRRRPEARPRYHLLLRIGERLATDVLRSVSKGHLQKLLLLVDRLLPNDDVQHVVEEWTAVDWLERYLEVGTGRERISVGQLQRHLRTLHVMHHRIFRPQDAVVVPVTTTGIVGRHLGYEGGSTASSSSLDFGSTGSSETDDAIRSEQQRARALVGTIRMQRCHGAAAAQDHHTPDQPERVFAFSAREIRAILLACTSTVERLVVLLLLTTGLRIGGLSRLRLPKATTDEIRGRDVPRTLPTTEKNGVSRTVVLTSAVRILVARWLREGGFGTSASASATTTYLFPSPCRPNAPVSTHHLWDVCRKVFRRARIAGPHVHPHTFRHTLVHLMHMGGTSFDSIAKFIGHSSPAITCAVYGRLQQLDAVSGVRGVPFLNEDADARARGTEWRAVGLLLRDPWSATHDEWEGLPRPSSST